MAKSKWSNAQTKITHEVNEKSLQRYYEYRAQQVTLAEQQREQIESISKILRTRPDFRMGISFLAGEPRMLDDKTKERFWPHYHICAIRGVDPVHNPSWPWLLEFKEKIVHRLEMKNEWSFKYRQSRIIECDGITQTMRKAFALQQGKKRIYMHNFLTYNERKAREADIVVCKELAKATSAYPQLDFMRKYLHGIPFTTFLNFKRVNSEKTLELAKMIDDDGEQQRIVQTMIDEVKPHYPVSLKNNPILARIYTPNFGNVMSILRRAYFAGCLEADFQNFHFALMVSYYPNIMRETAAWLSKGESIWKEIMKTMKIAPNLRGTAKGIIKPRVYSIEYGFDPLKAQELLHNDLKKARIPRKADLFNCVYVDELARATQQCLLDIRDKKELAGPYGTKQWDTTTKEESFLANVFQSWEIAVRFPCYEFASKQKAQCNSIFDIVLDQHDGFTVLPEKGKQEETKQQLLKIANKTLSDYKINSSLIFK